jgi:hydrogenase maturation protease
VNGCGGPARVLGMGNLLAGDDGAGVCVARLLADGYDFTPDVEVIDGALLGFGVLDVFDGGGPVLLVDALRTDAAPGTVYRLDADALLDLAPGVRLAAHEVEPVQQLRWYTALGSAPPTVLVCVAAGPPRFGVGLGAEVRAALDTVVRVALEQLEDWRVRVRPRHTRPSVDTVLRDLTGRRVPGAGRVPGDVPCAG